MKTPGNSVLKTMEPEVQENLYKAMNTGTTGEALAWLRKDHGVVVSEATASRWFGWYAATRTLREGAEAAEDFQDYLKEQCPTMPLEDVISAGNAAFMTLGVKNGDPKSWAMLLGAISRYQQTQNDSKKLELALSKLKEAEDIVSQEDSAEVKQTKLKKLFGRAQAPTP